MRQFAAWVAFATVAAMALAMVAAVGGCGPGKELPDEIAKTVDPGEKPVALPNASDPDAKEFIEKAVKAYTGGKPELVAKGKASRLALKGTILYPSENQLLPLPATRTIAAVWHDRFYASNDIDLGGPPVQVRTWLRGSELANVPEPDYDNRVDLAKSLPADVTGQHWLALFQPLTDPKAVVFDLQSTNAVSPHGGQSQAVRTLKLSFPDLPLYQLTFDAKTDLLLRTEYTVKQGVRRRTLWSALEHKPGPDGLMLPSKTECRHDGVVVEKWDVEKWEFPDKIDDAEFLPPKDVNPPKK